jgi:uncharacterized protein
MEEVWILILLFVCNYIGNTIGFGAALLLTPLLAIYIGTQNAIVILAFWGLFTAAVKVKFYWKHLDWEYVKGVNTFGIPGIIIGSYLIMYAPITILELILGLFTTIYSIYELTKFYKKNQREKYQRETNQSILEENSIKEDTLTKPVLYFGGFSYGFLGGLIGASGPINVALLEKKGYTNEQFIGNFAAANLILVILRITIYSVNDLFPGELLLVFILGIPIIYFSSKLGFYTARKISKEKFQLIILLVLLVIGLRLIIFSLISVVQ